MRFSLLHLFRRQTLRDIAHTELVEAQRRRLEAQTALDYAKASVDQHNATVTRLKSLLGLSGELVELGDAS